MMWYVSGGSGSGKSAFAEQLVVDSGIGERIYLATMEPFGDEGRRRIARHRALRAGKGFSTEERTTHLAGLSVPEGSAVLLEDLTNLFANEWFSVGEAGAAARVLDGLKRLTERSALTVVVGNDVFADGVTYGEETARYLHALAGLNAAAAAMADRVWEVVCGIPICWKGANR